MPKLVKPDYKIRRLSNGNYAVDFSNGEQCTIYKYQKTSTTNTRWKPHGRHHHYHPTLRDAIFAVIA